MKLVKTRDGRMFIVKDADPQIPSTARKFNNLDDALRACGVRETMLYPKSELKEELRDYGYSVINGKTLRQKNGSFYVYSSSGRLNW